MEKYCKNEKAFVYSIFSNQDSGQAIPILEKIKEDGICLWFSEEFSKKEIKRIEAAYSCVLFLSPHAVSDANVLQCIRYAILHNKKILCIYLEPTPLRPGLEFLLNALQSIDKNAFPDEQDFMDKMKSAEVFSGMQITAAQKRFAKRRALASVLIPVASAVSLFFAVVVPLLVVPMVQASTGSLSKVGFGNLTLSELAKVETLNVIGNQSYDQFYYSYYQSRKEGKQEVYVIGLNKTIPVGNIRDISDLAFLKNAKEIALEANQISDISPLFKISTLEQLTLNCNPIKSIEGIEALQNLKAITLVCTEISDISPLFKIPSLEQISFEITYVNSIEGIENLKGLIDLRTGNSNLTDISALNKMDFSYINETKGFGFEAKQSLIKDFSPLKRVPKFSEIMISVSRIDSILPYISSKQVNYLYIDRSDIQSISSLSSILDMKTLHLPGSDRLVSLDGIEKHTSLNEIVLEYCTNIKDYTSLLKLPNLKRLVLSSDMEALAGTQLAGAAFKIVYTKK